MAESERHKGEKGEKGEKQEKGGEKEEKYTKDPITAIFVGVVVIIAGILLYFASNELYNITWENVWNYILIGVGGAFLFSALLHSIIPQYRRPIFGEVILGVVLLMAGVVSEYEVEWWPLIGVFAGALIIIYGLGKMRKRKES